MRYLSYSKLNRAGNAINLLVIINIQERVRKSKYLSRDFREKIGERAERKLKREKS